MSKKSSRVALTSEDLRDLSRGLRHLMEMEHKMMDRGYDKSPNADVQAIHRAACEVFSRLKSVDHKLIRAAARLGSVI